MQSDGFNHPESAMPSRRASWQGIAGIAGVAGLATIGLTALDMRPEEKRLAAVAQEAGRAAADPSMVWIPGGTYRRGLAEAHDARPVAEVEVDGFWMDRTEVTNAQFAAFVRATG